MIAYGEVISILCFIFHLFYLPHYQMDFDEISIRILQCCGLYN